MLRVAWGQVRQRRGRSLAVVAAIVVGAVAFSLLSSAVSTSRLQVQGTVTSNLHAAYDILVRPKDSQMPLEASDGLLQENYLSGLFGGITRKQWRQIQQVPGVEVAAPIAMVGYVLSYSKSYEIPLNRYFQPGKTQQVFEYQEHWTDDGGTTHIAAPPIYSYVTRQPWLSTAESFNPHYKDQRDPTTGKTINVCQQFYDNVPDTVSPFSRWANLGMQCDSTTTPQRTYLFGHKPGDVYFHYIYSMPMLVAAIDPASEAKLVGLDDAVTRGRYLTEDDNQTWWRHDGYQERQIPVLMTNQLANDEQLTITVKRLDLPDQDAVPGQLVRKDATAWLASRPSETVKTVTLTGQELFQNILRATRGKNGTRLGTNYWTGNPVEYDQAPDGALTPQVRHNNPVTTWSIPGCALCAPKLMADKDFRKMHLHMATNTGRGNTWLWKDMHVVGEFDPNELPGFSELSEVPLTNYYPPDAEPGDARTSKILDGKPLLPNGDPAGYLQSPPALLTNMRSLKQFFDSTAFIDLSHKQASAPISVIRVRVDGLTGADDASQERLRLVAEQIERETGLDVDITWGSSPTERLVDLPAGNYGRPELTLKEGWVKKGAAVALLSALDRKSLALFGLVLVVCVLFLLNAVTAAVRSRAPELGILSCLGWSRWRIFTLLEAELAATGVVAGLAATAIAFVLTGVLPLQTDDTWWRLLLITPVATVLTGIAGLPPVLRAARAVPMQAIAPSVRPPRRARAVTSVTRLGLAGVLRTPARSALSALSLFVGVAALAALLAIQRQFSGNAVGTLLGDAVSIQVRGVDVFAAVLVLALGAFTIADVAYLNITERQPEIGTLRATGWTERHVQRLFATEGIAIAVVGAVAGAMVGVGVTGWLLGTDGASLVRAAAFAAAGGVVAAVIALCFPLVRLGALAPAAIMQE